MNDVDFVGLIANLGFPIAITSYLLLRFEKKIMELSKAINGLKKGVAQGVEFYDGRIASTSPAKS